MEHTAIDPEGIPLTAEQHAAELIEAVIARWVDIGYRTALAGLGNVGDEPARRKGVEVMRHLYLAEPWLPAHEAAAAIAREVLPLLRQDADT